MRTSEGSNSALRSPIVTIATCDRVAALHGLLPQRHAHDRHDRGQRRRAGDAWPVPAAERAPPAAGRRGPGAARRRRGPAPRASCGTGGLCRAASSSRRSRTRSAARVFCLASAAARAGVFRREPPGHPVVEQPFLVRRTEAWRRGRDWTGPPASPGQRLPVRRCRRAGARSWLDPYHRNIRRTRPAWRYAPSGKNSGASCRTWAR